MTFHGGDAEKGQNVLESLSARQTVCDVTLTEKGCTSKV